LKKYYYSYSEFIVDISNLSNQIKEYKPDAILAVARGGLTIGHFLAQALNIRRVLTLNSIHYDNDKKLDSLEIFNIPSLSSYKKVVIVDDIIDSGETLKEILLLLQNRYHNCEFKIATIFYKSTAVIKADYSVKEAFDWIDFFWEVDVV